MSEHPPAIDWDAFDAAIAALAREAGFLPAAPLGAPFAAWHRPGRGRRIYLSAGIHGDEPAGPLAIREILRAPWFRECPHDLTLCPTLNPHGLRAHSRGNAAGIDLNRDYRLRHTSEIAAHANWLLGRPPPDLFLSLHEDWETSGFYFYEINLGPDDPARARAILNAVAPIFTPQPGPEIDGHQARAPGWIFHEAEADVPDGWPEAIFIAKHGCPLSFTFETPSIHPLEQRIAALIAATRQAFVATEPTQQSPPPQCSNPGNQSGLTPSHNTPGAAAAKREP